MVENKTLKNGLFLSNLIGKIVTNRDTDISYNNVNWNAVLDLAVGHNVSNILYMYAKNIDCPDEIKLKLADDYNKAIIRDTKQDYMFQNVSDALGKNGIDFLPMKGISVKRLYPYSFMRTSVDTDILIKEKDRKITAQTLEELGLTLIDRGKVHDIYHKKPIYNYEMHISLFSKEFEYYNYFFDFWNKAVYNEIDGYYSLNNNDLFIYLFVHLYKHYVSGGCGIKLFLDIFLLTKKLELDLKYIEHELKSLDLYDFYATVITLNGIFFSGEQCEDKYETLCLYVLKSGNFGTKEVLSMTEIGSKNFNKNKLKFFLKSWFLNLETMKRFYPVLNKSPFLLPFCWIHKGFKALFFRRSSIKNELIKAKSLNKNSFNKFDKIKKMSGIK